MSVVTKYKTSIDMFLRKMLKFFDTIPDPSDKSFIEIKVENNNNETVKKALNEIHFKWFIEKNKHNCNNHDLYDYCMKEEEI